MMDIPGQRCRQWLGLKVVRQRREVGPGGIATQELDRPRKKHETEQQPSQQPYARLGRDAQKQRKKAGLQQKQNPLKTHEFLTGIKEREIKRIQEKQAHLRDDIQD